MTACTIAQLDACADEVTRQELVDLLCADEEWLRAEFDALVAASWGRGRPEPPSRGASPGAHRDGEFDRCSHMLLATAPAGPDPRPAARWTGRSRSPPVMGWQPSALHIGPRPDFRAGAVRSGHDD
jgi:hypothetical protein